ncbi:MAG: enoyl-ACP reductase [Chlamydiota bacterium]|nr:enoyl-ACP reductase [Chlamydiota bacterium]
MLMKDKVVLVLGVANKWSIAWSIAEALSREGANLVFTYQGERLKESVSALTNTIQGSLILPCDVTQDEEIDNVMRIIDERYGRLDGIAHCVAFAKKDELDGDYINTTREGFHLALDISAYSLTALVKSALPLLERNGASIVTLTYLGGERVIPNYNVMGVAKGALEISVRYLAADLGKRNIRINAVSAGPVSTLAARGITGFSKLIEVYRQRSPLQRETTAQEAADAALFLLSDSSRGMTGEIMHVDSGYHAMGV